MNQRIIATIGALLIGTAIISGCGSEKPLEDTSLKVRTITIGEESGTTDAGYAGTIHNKTETNLAFQIGGRVINKFGCLYAAQKRLLPEASQSRLHPPRQSS